MISAVHTLELIVALSATCVPIVQAVVIKLPPLVVTFTCLVLVCLRVKVRVKAPFVWPLVLGSQSLVLTECKPVIASFLAAPLFAVCHVEVVVALVANEVPLFSALTIQLLPLLSALE